MRRGTSAVGLLSAAMLAIYFSVFADAPAPSPTNSALPAHPVPMEKTNCVRCHLKAGRELTEAVHSFALSAHDAAGLSCNDCHGGNTEIDTKAHSDEFGFIGTKMSAHLAKCRSCHEKEAETLAKGPHFWDHDKKLNTKFPHCVDCHGNHDVGNVPAEFSLTVVCLDCHKDYKEKFPSYKALTDGNDALWASQRAFQAAKGNKRDAWPESIREEIAAVRAKTSEAIHGAHSLSSAETALLKQQIESLSKKLQSMTK